MNSAIGIGLAFVAMLCWGFGDYWIQKSTRKVGDWEALFVIEIFACVVLFPFTYRDLINLLLHPNFSLTVLIIAGLILLCASLLVFEAYKRGKLSVLDPIQSFEIFSASVLAFFVLGDRIDWTQSALIVALIVGLCLLSIKEIHFSKKLFLEKGVFLFLMGAILMGVADFFMGWGARLTNPLLANFIISVVMMVPTGLYLILRGQVGRVTRDLIVNRALLLAMSISDIVAWVAYALAMTLVPIAVATSLSEGSTIVAVMLGLVVNREKLQVHQKVGLAVAIISAMFLAAITSAV